MTSLAHLDRLHGAITNEIGRTLHDLAARVPGGRAIVEIGSYMGKSTAYLATGAAGDVPVYAVDVWETLEPSRWFRRKNWPVPTLGAFTAQLASVGLADRVTPLQGLSADVAKTYGGPPIGLLYIDGDHRAGAAEADFLAWRGYLAPGAVVVFDDYGVTRNPEVAKDVTKVEPFFDGPVTTANAARLAVARMP